MKKSLVFILLLFLSFSGSSQISNYWPANLGPMPKCNTMPTGCTKVASSGDWDKAATWSPSGVPGNDAVVCIPEGVVVNVKGQTYNEDISCPPSNTTLSPRLRIFLCGTIQFQNSGKLYLSCFSFIQIYTGGKILPPASGSGSSDLIQIGPHAVWGGPGSGNQGPVNGPFVLSWPYIGEGILPVAFEYFRAEQKQPYSIKLDWSTLQEQNNTDFIIERSIDQKTWSAIGSVKSAGNSSSRSLYSFNDNNPATGNNSYRIRQVDIDGRTTFSEIVRVNNQVKKNISVFPNPVTSSAQIFSKTTFKQGQTIQLVDARGTRIKTILTTGGNSMQLDMSALVKGLYLLQVVENGKVIESITTMKQ